ncbi:MAG: YbhB/YbcL family Raf kinase inhibitor-like protein [Deltaproteobacteria bacterium]|nr:YbhB/YbcL family Raf kinase inhibitor-like protein [Deltaproteobacteria bacterium]
MKRLAFVLAVAACGNDSNSPAIDAPPASDLDAPAPDGPGMFTLTSPMLTEGAAFALDNTCAGVDVSPQFDWVSPPAGTMSFAMTLIDKTINFRHSVIYDIPATATGLPADVDKAYEPADVPGAHQTASWRGAQVRGYAGPCPQQIHTYEFALHALDVAALPGATMQTNLQQAIALIEQHSIGKATLTGTHAPP